MENAKKCDRCGSLYELPKCSNAYLIIHRNRPYDRCIDLCPKCYEEFKQWIKFKEDEEV